MHTWKKTLYVTWIAEVIAIMGFSFVFPFLPYYIQELGIKEMSKVTLWTGLLATAAGLAMAISAPFWGILADRFGRKIMVERAMFIGGAIVILMALVKNVEQLLYLRLAQGFFTGTLTAAIALVASITPSERYGYSLGLMHSAVFTGASIGPLLGGILADSFGYRPAFIISGLFILFAGCLILFFVKEGFVAPIKKEKGQTKSLVRKFRPGMEFMVLLTVLFFLQFSNTSIAPIFPLFVQQLVKSPLGLATTAGSLIAVSGLFSAFGAAGIGKISDRLGYKNILLICLIFCGLLCISHISARNLFHLFWIRIFYGLFAGGLMPTVNGIIAKTTAQRDLGKAFGISGGISALGMAAGPITGGAIASLFLIQTTFIFSGAFLLMTAFLVAATLSKTLK